MRLLVMDLGEETRTMTLHSRADVGRRGGLTIIMTRMKGVLARLGLVSLQRPQLLGLGQQGEGDNETCLKINSKYGTKDTAKSSINTQSQAAAWQNMSWKSAKRPQPVINHS